MQYFLLLLAFGVQICFCLSSQILCTGNQTQSGTFYTILEFKTTGPDDDCPFSWSDNHDTVLANYKMKGESVEAANITSLHTKSCIPEIKYSCICGSEGRRMAATCFINCTSMGHLREPAKNTTSKPSDLPPVSAGHHWIVPLTVVCVLLIVIVVISCFILKDKLCRFFCRRLDGCQSFQVVQEVQSSQNGRPNEEHVEAEETRETRH